MIISEEHRYLFIEIPLTASWAVHLELCKYYGGKEILHKHASYPEFLRYMGKSARNYFVFASVRNPMDVIISSYYKLVTNHKGVFSDRTSADELITDYVDFKKFDYVNSPNASFKGFLTQFQRRPYGNLIDISARWLDFVIHYENLQEDFSTVLKKLNIEQLRLIPKTNTTSIRLSNWETYYTSDIRNHAMRVFGPFMDRWGYEFPPSWNYQKNHWGKWKYNFFNILREFYFTQFRYSDKLLASFVRKLRAKFH